MSGVLPAAALRIKLIVWSSREACGLWSEPPKPNALKSRLFRMIVWVRL